LDLWWRIAGHNWHVWACLGVDYATLYATVWSG
jgi:hypothetical protein